MGNRLILEDWHEGLTDWQKELLAMAGIIWTYADMHTRKSGTVESLMISCDDDGIILQIHNVKPDEEPDEEEE